MNTDPKNPGPYSDREWAEIVKADREAEERERQAQERRKAKQPATTQSRKPPSAAGEENELP